MSCQSRSGRLHFHGNDTTTMRLRCFYHADIHSCKCIYIYLYTLIPDRCLFEHNPTQPADMICWPQHHLLVRNPAVHMLDLAYSLTLSVDEASEVWNPDFSSRILQQVKVLPVVRLQGNPGP